MKSPSSPPDKTAPRSFGRSIRTTNGAAANDSIAEVRAFLGHRGPVQRITFSRDGQMVASAGDDQRLLVWKPSDVRPYRLSEVFADPPPKATPHREFLGHQAAVIDAAFSPDGKRLVSGGLDNTLIVWDVAEGRPLKTVTRPCRTSTFVSFLARRSIRIVGRSRRHDSTLERRRV